jgi:alpha-mannosidase
MNSKRNATVVLSLCLSLQLIVAKAQNNYFIDGYHGGIWGHYPPDYTGFISDMLDKNPFWRINLEIEPVTWDNVKRNDPVNYQRFQQLAIDQSAGGRIEFVNPGYGQSYLFNIQGESIIRQFDLGMRKIREHFSNAEFTTYSSEEPCFTSALPQILTSFGFQYASLKNPNTCWGGYTTAHGGETVNWTGPDGTAILTVPRYASEKLLPGSTWQTNAWNNSKEYLRDAREMGIANPIGMCLQDAGWKNGPWLGQPKGFEYQTWRHYMGNIALKKDVPAWNFTQENVQVSLVWGSQILQKLAQNVRRTENHLVMAEKLQAIQAVYQGVKTEKDQFKNAWENLLLAQHHDSWIVPYNIVDRSKKLNWADQVKIWTDNANRLSDSVLYAGKIPDSNEVANDASAISVYNTVAQRRREVVQVGYDAVKIKNPRISDARGATVLSQQITDSRGNKALLFMADVPSMGFSGYTIDGAVVAITPQYASQVTVQSSKYRILTDQYDILLNPLNGGVIESLRARKLGNKEFVQPGSKHFFNEMKGYFYKDSAYHSSAATAAKISIIEDGPLRVRLKIEGKIDVHPFTQYLTLTQVAERIDIQTKIDWQGNPGIGQGYNQTGPWKAETLKKAFYNDSYKLSAFFPLNLKQQQLYKNAAFDVLKSKLINTVFNTWDSIKNNIIVNWVDVTAQGDDLGMALLTDHTTSYSHDESGTLGLTLQYSGMGLWGRNYSINGPSELNYSILPHAKRWDRADLWTQSLKWNEPLKLTLTKAGRNKPVSASLISLSEKGYEVSAVQKTGNELTFRIFNASGQHRPVTVTVDAPKAGSAQLTELNGAKIRSISLQKQQKGKQNFTLTIPEFGIRTIKLQL